MKQGNISGWKGIESCTNLLMFAELINEMLFDYSIPSNRIATLNSHFLCKDAVQTILTIERNGVPQGTLTPIVEELYDALKKDVVFQLSGENPLRFFLKSKGDRYRISTDPSELNFEESKKAVTTINSKYFTNNWYLNELQRIIENLICKNRKDDWLSLFRVTKSYLTELVNQGFNPRYIFETAEEFFFSENSQIASPNVISDFLGRLKCKSKEYSVVFVVNQHFTRFTRMYEALKLEATLEEKVHSEIEKSFLKKRKDQLFLEIKRTALDPYSAAIKARSLLSDNIAFYRICDHSFSYSIDKAPCGVYCSDGSFYRVTDFMSPLLRTRMPSEVKIKSVINRVEKAMDEVSTPQRMQEFLGFINASNFHSLSLDSHSNKNQLLDLWAIIETLLNVSNEHTSDRIHLICQRLIPILRKTYFYSLFYQLSNDIKNYDEDEYRAIIGEETDEDRIIEKVCFFTLLNDKAEERNAFLKKCEGYPLLVERINYYNENLNSPYKIYGFVEKHCTRVKWQIMRIYRNRNMIIHNGQSMPYLPLLIENLHSYVDDLLSSTLQAYSEGKTFETMCQELYSDECDWIEKFGSRSKAENTEETIKQALYG